jgi:hypothetical protein
MQHLVTAVPIASHFEATDIDTAQEYEQTKGREG